MASQKLSIGMIVRAHGIRGWVRVRGTSDAILEVERVWLDGREVKVLERQREKDEFLVRLEGVLDRTQAEALRGVKLEVSRDELTLADDELYVADLVGCQVFDKAGLRLGEVASTFDSGAHEVLVVRGDREFMIPFVDEMVTEVDVEGRRIVCDLPPGLVNLDDADSDP